jgi:hypothetical protein
MNPIGLSPDALLGQPTDSILAWVFLALVLLAVGLAGWGVLKFKSKQGRMGFVGGAVGVIIFAVLMGATGIPGLPAGSFGVQPPGGTGGWQLCVTNANYASVGVGTCVSTISALVTFVKGNPAPASAANKRIYFNVSLTPPPGSTQVAYNEIATVAAPPTVTNTSAPTTTGPVLALTSSGQYDVLITPSGGTATTQLVVIPVSPGTAKTAAYQVHMSSIGAQLALAQYPLGFTLVFTFQDQGSGSSIGTVQLTVTFN